MNSSLNAGRRETQKDPVFPLEAKGREELYPSSVRQDLLLLDGRVSLFALLRTLTG